jgi:hypothetical protein
MAGTSHFLWSRLALIGGCRRDHRQGFASITGQPGPACAAVDRSTRGDGPSARSPARTWSMPRCPLVSDSLRASEWKARGRQEHAADGQGEERYDRAAHPRQPFGARGTGRAPTTCDSRSAERGDAGGQDYEGDYAVKRHGPAESEVSELQPHWTRIVDLLRGRGVRCRHRRPLKGQTRSRQGGTANVRAGRQAARWPALTGMTTAGSWRCGGARRSKRWGASSRSAW